MVQVDLVRYKKYLWSRVGLSLLAVLLVSLLSTLMNHLSFQKNEKYASIINVSGRQRMLSQRTNYFLNDFLTTKNSDSLKELIKATNLMEESHLLLTTPIVYEGLSTSRKAKEFYFGKNQLDEKVRSHIKNIRSLVNQKLANDAFATDTFKRTKIFAQTGLLKDLNEVVKIYEQESEASIERFKMYGLIAQALLLLTLVMVASIVFKPMIIQILGNVETIDAEKEKALAGIKSREQFLANMSHEIRTPLNGIMGMSQLLNETPLNPEQQDYVKTMREASENLSSIINDILDMSMIEAGEFKIQKNTFNLHELLESLETLFSPMIMHKNLKMNVDIDPSLPHHIFSDELRIRQVIINLTNNALKFTQSGSISIMVKFVRDKIQFEISDTGMGISYEDQSKLFQSFYQADQSMRKRHEGTGLGLAISKHFVEKLGGQMMFSSQEGEGTTFTFTIPYEQAREFSLITKQENDFSHLRILIAEDNEINQKFISSLLKKMKISFDMAINGEVAVNMMKENDYDIVLMDLSMPVMDGFEATEEIRKRNKDIPIIALTANAFDKDKERALEIGMNDFLSKPLKKNNLEIVLSKFSKKQAA
jgi:signal transduction histidine kinase/ActR/RegA family two-component response regulator